MKTLRLLGKVAGLMSVAAIFSSCHKEKDCKCTSTYSVNGVVDPNYGTDTQVYTTEEKCWELNGRYVSSYTYGGTTTEVEYKRECEKN